MKVSHLHNLLETNVSHNPKIKKKLLIANGVIPKLTNFSRAVFPPGEIAPSHVHKDMTEVFFIESGQGEFAVNDELIPLEAGVCVTIEPGDLHELRNMGSTDLCVIYFGIES